MGYETFQEIMQRVIRERQRQMDKWGKQSHSPAMWIAILTEEVGEAAQAVVKENIPHARDELIHVIAVAIEMLEEGF